MRNLRKRFSENSKQMDSRFGQTMSLTAAVEVALLQGDNMPPESWQGHPRESKADLLCAKVTPTELNDPISYSLQGT